MTDWPSDLDDARATTLEEVNAFLVRLEDLQNSGDYTWASESLAGIHETVEKAGRVTPNQQRAIDNIEAGGQRGRRSRGW